MFTWYLLINHYSHLKMYELLCDLQLPVLITVYALFGNNPITFIWQCNFELKLITFVFLVNEPWDLSCRVVLMLINIWLEQISNLLLLFQFTAKRQMDRKWHETPIHFFSVLSAWLMQKPEQEVERCLSEMTPLKGYLSVLGFFVFSANTSSKCHYRRGNVRPSLSWLIKSRHTSLRKSFPALVASSPIFSCLLRRCYVVFARMTFPTLANWC